MNATQQRFSAALEALIDQVQTDRSILAAILCGSLSHDVVWEKSDIDLMLVTIDDRKVEASDVPLYADGVNVHVNLIPRAQFRKIVDGSLHNSFVHALLAKSRLLYTHDETIADVCRRLNDIGARDTQVQLLRAATHALPSIYKAHKWFITRGDLDYTALWILDAATPLAQIEVVSRRQIADREVIPQALQLNPTFFTRIYSDLLNTKKISEGRPGRARCSRWVHQRAGSGAVCTDHRTFAGCWRGAFVEGNRRSFQPAHEHQPCDDGVRVPRGSGDDWEGVAAGPAHEKEHDRCPGTRILLSERFDPPLIGILTSHHHAWHYQRDQPRRERR